MLAGGKKLTDSPSNLKKAIDWILRVTGKDGGGGGQDGTQQLAQAVKGLEGFTDAIKAAADKLKESGHGEDNAPQALEKLNNPRTLEEIIKKLADGLAALIGYQIGTIKYSSGGIGLPNDPRERLGDAVLGFVIKFLERLKAFNILNGNVDSVIAKLNEGNGGDIYMFEEALKNVKNLNDSNGQIEGVLSALNGIGGLFDGLSTMKSTITVRKLAEEVSKHLGKVLGAVKTEAQSQAQSELESLKTSLTGLVDENKEKWMSGPIYLSAIKDKIEEVSAAQNNLSRPLHSISGSKAKYLVSAVISGTSQFMSQLKRAHYASYYQGVQNTTELNTPTTNEAQKCAKIFLGCLPMVFSSLSYLYWRCDQEINHGGWKRLKLGSDGSLKDFMLTMAYNSKSLKVSTTGGDIVAKALKKFKDFTEALPASSTPKKSYADFLTQLKKNGFIQIAQDPLTTRDGKSLSALYAISTFYFTGRQINNTSAFTNTPSTIRQMLYFLAALPFSPELGECEKHIEHVLSKPLPITIAGTTAYSTLTADKITSNLTTTALFSARILGLLQGLGYSKEKSGEPWLHHLYCNGLKLKYPSGSELFNAISNYSYALQFQLHFLYRQCSVTQIQGCGWRDCRFGSSVTTGELESYICSAGCSESGHNNGDHSSNSKCKHKDCSCNSPLQAFLTDNLKGFSLSKDPDLTSSNHLENHPRGSMCHVKMGFTGKLRDDSVPYNGHSIMHTLNFMCADVSSPFRRIYENLLCLLNRTPRTLGELFGFYWQFVVLLNKDASEKKRQYFSYAFLRASLGNSGETTVLIRDFSNMNASNKSHLGQHPADLLSLYYPDCGGESCGPYLFPLVYTTGATFSPKFASTYLSWLVYLADDFGDWLTEFLERFDGLKCDGCKHHCSSQHNSHNHGSDQACKCPSITQCADVLPLYYEYGFTILDPIKMNGWKWDQTKRQWQSDTSTKRSCNAFHSQLQAVINGDPLSSLLTSIDSFLYAIRWEFFSKLSGFWTIYICLILYTFFFLLDTLHLRSHLKLTSSHMVPPLALLTQGTPLPITKLTYIEH